MTLRRFFYLSIALNAALVVVLAVSLIVSTSLQRKFTSVHERTLVSIESAYALEIALYEYNRLANLYLLTGSPHPLSERIGLRERIEQGIQAAAQNIDSEAERVLVRDIAATIDAFLLLGGDVESNPSDYPADIAQRSELFENSSALVAQLVEVNRAQSMQADLKVSQLDRAANVFGTFLLLLVTGLSLWAARSSKLRIFAPLAGTARGVGEFPTNPETRLPVVGVKEIQLIAHEFNRMADQLAENRQRQLAFLAGVAHDLRNPLTAIKSQLELIQLRMPSPEALPKKLEPLRRQVERLNGMVQDLLDANRIEAGQLEIRLAWADLTSLILESIALFKPGAPHHVFVFEPPPQAVMVYCDSLRVVQVLNNLISNAIKFSPRGGEVAVALVDSDAEIRLSVGDQGVGIRDADLPRLFEPFYRAPTVKSGISGVGLGLSITQKIIEAHGGTITVQSQYGAGARFDVTLPRGGPIQ